MNRSNTAKLALAAQSTDLNFRHIVNARRSAEEDHKYHIKARRSFRRITQLVGLAERYRQLNTCLYCSARVRDLRRQLFDALIEDVCKGLLLLHWEDDALCVWSGADSWIEVLISAIGDYFEDVYGREWAIGRLRAGLEVRP
jgi:hypothetical protein